MPVIELPNNQSATIKTRDEITERISRRISSAYMRAAGSAAKLAGMGLVADDPTTWTVWADISEEDQANLDGYQSELIVGFVKSWNVSEELPTLDSTLDLPKATFDALALACSEEFTKGLDLDPNPDPKAPIAD